MNRILLLIGIIITTFLLLLIGGSLWLKQDRLRASRDSLFEPIETTAETPEAAAVKLLQLSIDKDSRWSSEWTGKVASVFILSSAASKGDPNLWTVKGIAGIKRPPGSPAQATVKTVAGRPDLPAMQWEMMPAWDSKRRIWHTGHIKKAWIPK